MRKLIVIMMGFLMLLALPLVMVPGYVSVHDENEPIKPVFNVINKYPPVVRCHYCEKLIKTEDIDKQFE